MENSIGNVGFIHPQYRAHLEQVRIVKDVYNGSDTAKAYLTQFPQELAATYEERKDKIALRNFVKRATEAFVGMIFRKPVDTLGYSPRIDEIVKRIDTKSTLNQFSRTLTETLIRDGSTYILVDSSRDNEYNAPYFVNITRAEVINWRKNQAGDFTMIVLQEEVEEALDDFEIQYVRQYRVYSADGNITIYRERDNNYYIQETITTGFDYIPIVELKMSDIPPLYDIARLNIKHMNRTSAKDRYLDMAACPVPVIWGAGIDDEENVTTAKPALVIGVDEAFIFTSKEEGDFQWRELSGSSIDQLQKDLKVIEDDITSGVIRASQSESTTMKTATQSFYEAAESSNRVTVIANIVEYALNRAMDILCDFVGEPESVGVVIVNKDFNAVSGNTTDLRLLWEMYLGGALSISTLLTSMQQYELINIGSSDEEVKRIEQDDFMPESKLETTDDKVLENSDNNTVSAMTNDEI
jgi:hypothetical protein